MERLVPLFGAEGNESVPCERVVQDGAGASDGERENQALDIEPRALSELEKTGRIPVRGNEDRLGQAEEGGGEARTPHHVAGSCVPQIERNPGQEKELDQISQT
jgi:hypothetical protein